MNLHVAIETNANGWNQVYPFADINARTSRTTTVSIPLSSFNLTSGIASANLHFGFDGTWSNGVTATAYIDRVTLVDLHPDTGDFNADGRVDGRDFLAWQRGLGASRTAAELAIWKQQFGGTVAAANAGAVPEPASATLLVVAALLSWSVSSRSRAAAPPATGA